MRGTRGGPARPITFIDVDNEVKEMLGTRIESMQSEFAGDAEGISPCDKSELKKSM